MGMYRHFTILDGGNRGKHARSIFAGGVPSQPVRPYTTLPELLSWYTADIEKVLEDIEREKIIPSLSVMQVPSKNRAASVGLVKKWLMGRIKQSREEIHTHGRPRSI